MSHMRKGSHTWEVKNVGHGELEMWLDHSSCSCTIAKLQTKDPEGIEKPHVHVKPNATTTIELEWDTKTFPETAYHKTAVIGTNDPRHQTFTLHISGKVFPPVSVYPPEMIDFKGVSNEELAKSSVAVYSMDMPTMKINKISTSRPSSSSPSNSLWRLTSEVPSHFGWWLQGRRRDQAGPAAGKVYRRAGPRNQPSAAKRAEGLDHRLCHGADQHHSRAGADVKRQQQGGCDQ